MANSKTLNEQMKEERKNAIIKASLKLFSINGYDAVHMNDIAKECSCSHGLLYHYYSSKEQILHDVLEYCHTMLTDYKLFIYDNNKITSKDQLIHFCDTVASILNGTIEEVYFLYMITNFRFQKTLPTPPWKNKISSKECKTIRSILEDIIIRGQKDGTIYEGNPKEMVMEFHSLIRGMAFERIKLNDEEYIKPTSKGMQRLLIKG